MRNCITCGCYIACPEGDEHPICEECADNAFRGLEESYIEMDRKIMKAAPICHFSKMIFETEDSEYGIDSSWWECQHCGHTKMINR